MHRMGAVNGFEASRARVAPHADADTAPLLIPGHLDSLWFQVAGTVCNIRCAHCFISCSPTNHAFGFLSLEDVRRRLEESVPLGVREFYFTGGEPFLHPRIVEILALALEYGPTSVLTNGMLLKHRHLEPLAAAAAESPYSLEFRVSIDGFDAAGHDAIRGAGSFAAATQGVQLLLAHGFLPIVTAVQTWEPGEDPEVYAAFVAMLRGIGYHHPRIKLLPVLRIGAEAARSHGYVASERVTNAMMEGYDAERLLCASARIVTDRGVWVCPILLDAPEGNLGDDLAAAAGRSFRLSHAACSTCWLHGAICANPGTAALEAGARGAIEIGASNGSPG
ncbi:MAG TPA: radical SAM protein [Gemmatimonadota bacterium]|nr:radical SAM protein [Gemmatimonadota bacterium]